MTQLNRKASFANLISIVAMIALFAAGCLQGPGLFKKEGGDSENYSMISTDTDGVVTGRFSSASSATQILSASGDISGANVAFPPGALAIDTNISIEQGANIASSGFASELGLGTGVTSRSSSVVVSTSLQIDASRDFTMSIPVSKTSLMLSDETYDTLVVFYKVYKASDKSYFVGLIPRSDITISNDTAQFKTKYFGSYQLAETDEKVTKAVEASTTTPIVTKAQEKTLDPITWSVGSPSYVADRREATMKVKVSGFQGISKCSIFVHKKPSLPAIYTDFTTNQDDIGKVASGGDDVKYKIQTDEAQTLYFRFECEDNRGVRSASQFSAALEVPAKSSTSSTSSSGGGTSGVALSFDARFLPTSAPNLRAIDAATASVTVTGDCDSSLGSVNLRIDEILFSGNPISAFACVDNRFSIPIAFHSGASCSSNLCMTSANFGGYGLYLSQGSMSIKTVLFKIDTTAVASFEVVSTQSTLLAALVAAQTSAHKVIVLGTNIDLTGWTPFTYNDSDPLILDGDSHSLNNFSYASASPLSNIGVFAAINGSGPHRVSHLTVNSPVITLSNSSGTISKVGGLVGDFSCTTCSLVDITVASPNITNTSSQAAAASIMGGLAGYVAPGASLFDVFVDHANISAPMGTSLGGLVGETAGQISKAWANVPSVRGYSEIGGLIGMTSTPAAAIYNDLKVTDAQITLENGGMDASSLVGKMDLNLTINRVLAIGTMNSGTSSTKVGGLCGLCAGNFNDAMVSATVNGGSNVGGVFGYMMSGTIQRVKAATQISGATSPYGYLGGTLFGGSFKSTVLQSGNANAGSLVGGKGSSYVFDGIYYLVSIGVAGTFAGYPTLGTNYGTATTAQINDMTSAIYSSWTSMAGWTASGTVASVIYR